MDSIQYKKILPSIDLPERVEQEKIVKNKETKEKPVFVRYDLNTADAFQLTKIYGVGPKLSHRHCNLSW